MTSTIVHDHTPTGELGVINDPAPAANVATDRPRGGWISEDRPSGRHRADRAGLQHVSAIAGVDLRRRPQRAGATHGLLARLLGGAA